MEGGRKLGEGQGQQGGGPLGDLTGVCVCGGARVLNVGTVPIEDWGSKREARRCGWKKDC